MKKQPNREANNRRGSPQLIIEKSDGELWGRVTIKNTLIVENATTFESLLKKLKNLILEFEEVEVNDFVIVYDLTTFFENHSYLSITDIAKRTNINPGLMRQYASGVKFPSVDRVKLIEESIRQIGKELTRIKLHKPKREFA